MARQDKKTQLVVSYLIDYLEKNKFSSNNKLPSENSLSESLAVSRFTVRQAIDLLCSQGIIYKVQGSGTFFNKDNVLKQRISIKEKNADLKIALILQGHDRKANNDLQLGIKSIFDEKDVYCKSYVTDNKFANEKNCIETLMHENFDGFIVDGVKASLLNPNLSLYKKCYDELNIPIIFYNNYYKELNYPKVIIDGRLAAFKLTSYLIAMGHEKIAGIFVCDNYQSVEKFHGMYEAMQKHKIHLDDSYIKWCVSDDAHNDSGFDKNIEKFLQNIPQCTAIVCCNSIIYKLVKLAVKKMGKKFNIVCMDLSSSEFFNDVTCSLNQGYLIGQLVAKNLLLMIEKKDFKENPAKYSCILPPQICYTAY